MNTNQNQEDAIKRGLEKYMNITNKNILKKNMLYISLFVLLYGCFCEKFVKPVRKMLCNNADFDETTDERNEETVLSVVSWFVEQGALTNVDIPIFEEIINKWNRYVHEMSRQLYDGIEPEQDQQLFVQFWNLCGKLDCWWKVNYSTSGNCRVETLSMENIIFGTLFSDDEIVSMF